MLSNFLIISFFSCTQEETTKRFKISDVEPIEISDKIIIQRIHHPKMHYDSYRVIEDEIWWMKPLNKDKEDESFTIYKGKIMERR